MQYSASTISDTENASFFTSKRSALSSHLLVCCVFLNESRFSIGIGASADTPYRGAVNLDAGPIGTCQFESDKIVVESIFVKLLRTKHPWRSLHVSICFQWSGSVVLRLLFSSFLDKANQGFLDPVWA
ncbi:hypothetical protein ACNR90_004803 [Candidozyma auris]|nr:hypothetical protein QG37_06706 [[Candida] auris]